jgi:hypothetical protein
MAVTQSYPIRCPECGADQQVDLVEAVHAREEPELRDDLLANRLNAVTCPQCGFSFRVDKPLLYHDADREFVLICIPCGDDAIDDGLLQFQMYMDGMRSMLPGDIEAPDVQFAASRVEMAERIFVMEAGLDPRIVEYIKYLIHANNFDRVHPREKRLLLNVRDSTDETLRFVVQNIETGKLEGLLEYERQAYDALREMFDDDDATPELLELFPGPYLSARQLMIREEEEPEE